MHAVAGSIATIRGTAAEVRIGDFVRRETRHLASASETSVRVVERPMRHGSVWMIRGWSSALGAPVNLYPFRDELVVITRAQPGSVDAGREADVASALAPRGGV
jgi:hypothetical protein